MADKVLWVEEVEYTACEVLGEALLKAMRENNDNIMDCRSYCEKYGYPQAVAIVVDTDDHDETDKSEWVVVIVDKPVKVGDFL